MFPLSAKGLRKHTKKNTHTHNS